MKHCKLKVVNHHSLNGEKTESTVHAMGDFEWKGDDGSFKINYKEELEEAVESITTVYFKDADHISISRSGPLSPNLELVKGEETECIYTAPFAEVTMLVETKDIKSDMTENGGTLEMSYSIDFNNGDVSDNKTKITVKEIH